jgi:hypothetical protein
MEKKQIKKQFYNQWWFWVMVFVLGLVIVGVAIEDCQEEYDLIIDYCDLANGYIEYSNVQTEYINGNLPYGEEPLELFEYLEC